MRRTTGSALFHLEVEPASLVMKADSSRSVATCQFTVASDLAEPGEPCVGLGLLKLGPSIRILQFVLAMDSMWTKNRALQSHTDFFEISANSTRVFCLPKSIFQGQLTLEPARLKFFMNFIQRALGLWSRIQALGIKESALRYYRSGDIHQLYGKEVGKDHYGNMYVGCDSYMCIKCASNLADGATLEAKRGHFLFF